MHATCDLKPWQRCRSAYPLHQNLTLLDIMCNAVCWCRLTMTSNLGVDNVQGFQHAGSQLSHYTPRSLCTLCHASCLACESKKLQMGIAPRVNTAGALQQPPHLLQICCTEQSHANMSDLSKQLQSKSTHRYSVCLLFRPCCYGIGVLLLLEVPIMVASGIDVNFGSGLV